MNKAANPTFIHCSWVGFFQFILEDLCPHLGWGTVLADSLNLTGSDASPKYPSEPN